MLVFLRKFFTSLENNIESQNDHQISQGSFESNFDFCFMLLTLYLIETNSTHVFLYFLIHFIKTFSKSKPNFKTKVPSNNHFVFNFMFCKIRLVFVEFH